MADINEILRLNPTAAAGIDGVRQVLSDVQKLREAGIAKGPALPSFGAPKSISDLKVGSKRAIFNRASI